MGKTKKRKLRRGGDSIQGAQGCVVIPSLITGPDGKRDITKVTKIFFLDKDFEEEKAQNDIMLSTIDPAGKFTSASYTETPINLADMTPDEVSKCYGLKGKDITKLKFLNYKHLGVSINELMQRPITLQESKKILISLSALLPKIIEMNKTGVFHNDVHIGNILYNARDEHAYLIDFGLMTSSAKSPIYTDIIPRIGSQQLAKQLSDIIGFLYVIRQFSKYVSDQSDFPREPAEFLARNVRFISPLISKILTNGTDLNQSRIEVLQFVVRLANTLESIKGGSKKKKTLRRVRH